MPVETYRKSSAAEGITLSGSGNRKDCKRTALWRSPLNWMPKVKGSNPNLSGKRTEHQNFSQGISFAPETVFVIMKAVFIFKEEKIWTLY